MNYQYTYLIKVGIFCVIWLFLYFLRKDIRKEMIVLSVIFGFGGILSELVYIQDWWQPLTITNTPIGPEDFLVGFFISGIASVIYKEIFHKKVELRKKTNYSLKNILLSGGLLILIFYGSFYFLKQNSFYSSILGFLIPTLIIWFRRKDLIITSILSGALILIIGTLVYFLLNIFQAGFIYEFWSLQDVWFAKLLFGIPLAEYIWYFLAGMFIGPLYEYWKKGKLINTKT